MEIARFFAFVVKVAILLAILGQLKTCTLIMLGLAADRSATGIMSYGRYTRELTR